MNAPDPWLTFVIAVGGALAAIGRLGFDALKWSQGRRVLKIGLIKHAGPTVSLQFAAGPAPVYVNGWHVGTGRWWGPVGWIRRRRYSSPNSTDASRVSISHSSWRGHLAGMRIRMGGISAPQESTLPGGTTAHQFELGAGESSHVVLDRGSLISWVGSENELGRRPDFLIAFVEANGWRTRLRSLPIPIDWISDGSPSA